MHHQQHMYAKSPLLVLALAVVMLSLSCSEPDSPADQLLTEAAALISSAQTAQHTSFSEALRFYQAALAKAQTARLHVSTAKEEKSDFVIGSTTFKVLKDTLIPQTMVRAQAEESPLACALLVARTIPDAQTKTALLEQITQAYIKAGHYEHAVQATQFIADAHRRADLLKQIALGTIRAGDYAQGLRLAQRIARLTDQALFGVEVLTHIALRYVKAGQYEHALQVAHTTPRPSSTAWIMTEIAGAQEQEDVRAKASTTLPQAAAIAQKIPNDSLKSLVQGQIGQTYARLGDYPRALAVTQTIREVRHRIDTIVVIAAIAIEAGNLENAQQLTETLTNSEKTLSKSQLFTSQALIEIAHAMYIAEMLPEQRQAEVYGRIAQTYLQQGNVEQALKLAQAIQVPQHRTQTMMQLAQKLAETGNRGQALQLANTIEPPQAKEATLLAVATAHIQAGQYPAALEAAQAASDAPAKANLLARVAAGYAKYAPRQEAEKSSGLFAQALTIAKIGKTPQTRAQSLVGVGSWHLQTEQEIAGEPKEILHGIVAELGDRLT